jgi:hypothetical protein
MPATRKASKHLQNQGAWRRVILSPPGPDDVIRLLKAWRFWLLGTVLGALLGAALFVVAPPPYRARATVNVDFHLEQAWPDNTDREQFYYLERETRKLVEIAMSDAVLAEVAGRVPGVEAGSLRGGALKLSQPGNGGWHFYADHKNPQTAAELAAAWAKAFTEQVERQVAAASDSGPEPFITADVAQAPVLATGRNRSVAVYMVSGAAAFLALSALGLLFLRSSS